MSKLIPITLLFLSFCTPQTPASIIVGLGETSAFQHPPFDRDLSKVAVLTPSVPAGSPVRELLVDVPTGRSRTFGQGYVSPADAYLLELTDGRPWTDNYPLASRSALDKDLLPSSIIEKTVSKSNSEPSSVNQSPAAAGFRPPAVLASFDAADRSAAGTVPSAVLWILGTLLGIGLLCGLAYVQYQHRISKLTRRDEPLNFEPLSEAVLESAAGSPSVPRTAIDAAPSSARRVCHVQPLQLRPVTSEGQQVLLSVNLAYSITNPFDVQRLNLPIPAVLKMVVESAVNCELGKHDLAALFSNQEAIGDCVRRYANGFLSDYGVRVEFFAIAHFDGYRGVFSQQVQKRNPASPVRDLDASVVGVAT